MEQITDKQKEQDKAIKEIRKQDGYMKGKGKGKGKGDRKASINHKPSGKGTKGKRTDSQKGRLPKGSRL